jgi:hypothetical protein
VRAELAASAAGSPDTADARRRACGVLARGGWSTAYQVAQRRAIADALDSAHGVAGLAPAAMARTGVLPDLVREYDARFFCGLLDAVFGRGLVIRWNSRLTRTGGTCTAAPDDHRAKIDVSVRVMDPVHAAGGAEFLAGGVACSTALGAIQLVVEHELVHALIGACWWACGHDSRCAVGARPWPGRHRDGNGHSTWFMRIQYNLFGQDTYTHGLLRSVDEAARLVDALEANRARLRGVRPGSTVTIRLPEGETAAVYQSSHPQRFKCTVGPRIILVPYRLLV